MQMGQTGLTEVPPGNLADEAAWGSGPVEVNIAPHCVQSKSNFFKTQFYIFLFWWADDEDNMYIWRE